jgi:large subunit ribosomal protein L30
MAKKTKDKKIKITQVRSIIGQQESHKRTIEALGLKRLNQSVVKADTPQIRGMIFKVQHLVSVEEID